MTFSLGLGITIGVFNVFFRDVGQFFNVLMQFWFWFTPIVYSAKILPDAVNAAIAYNPLAPLVAAYQTILVEGEWPDWSSLWMVMLLGILLCITGLHLFRSRIGEMLDEL